MVIISMLSLGSNVIQIYPNNNHIARFYVDNGIGCYWRIITWGEMGRDFEIYFYIHMKRFVLFIKQYGSETLARLGF